MSGVGRFVFLLCTSLALVACKGELKPQPTTRATSPMTRSDESKRPAPKAIIKAEDSAKTPENAAQATEAPAEVSPENTLTEEEEALLAADFSTLTGDEKKARAVALRKKLTQDPNSDLARSLKRLDEELESGEYKQRALKAWREQGGPPHG